MTFSSWSVELVNYGVRPNSFDSMIPPRLPKAKKCATTYYSECCVVSELVHVHS